MRVLYIAEQLHTGNCCEEEAPRVRLMEGLR